MTPSAAASSSPPPVNEPPETGQAQRPQRSGRAISDYAADWESNAQVDARFAILSDPGHVDAWSTSEFLQTGETEIGSAFGHLGIVGLAPPATGRALDFGCGLGRLTQALGRRFGEAVGVDVAPTMVAEARGLEPDPNVSFVLNQSADLSCFDDGSFDFVYSNIVLQHLSNDLQRAYLAEFCRVLAPGGLAVFQIPSGRRGVLGAVRRGLPDDLVQRLRGVRRPNRLLRRDVQTLRMEMNCLGEHAVADVLRTNGARVVDVVFTNAAEPGFAGQVRYFNREQARDRAGRNGYLSPQYTVRRTGTRDRP